MASNDRNARADLNLLHAVKAWANAGAASSVWEADDVVFASSGIPIRSFNNVFLTGPLASPNPHLNEAIEHFENRGVPFRLRVRDDINGVTEDVVVAAGFESPGIGVSILCPGAVRTEIWNAGRNRPERFGGPQQAPEEFRNFLASGMDPDEVGRLAVQGIRRGDFFILSHPQVRGIVEARYKEMLAAFDAQAPGE